MMHRYGRNSSRIPARILWNNSNLETSNLMNLSPTVIEYDSILANMVQWFQLCLPWLELHTLIITTAKLGSVQLQSPMAVNNGSHWSRGGYTASRSWGRTFSAHTTQAAERIWWLKTRGRRWQGGMNYSTVDSNFVDFRLCHFSLIRLPLSVYYEALASTNNFMRFYCRPNYLFFL